MDRSACARELAPLLARLHEPDAADAVDARRRRRRCGGRRAGSGFCRRRWRGGRRCGGRYCGWRRRRRRGRGGAALPDPRAPRLCALGALRPPADRLVRRRRPRLRVFVRRPRGDGGEAERRAPPDRARLRQSLHGLSPPSTRNAGAPAHARASPSLCDQRAPAVETMILRCRHNTARPRAAPGGPRQSDQFLRSASKTSKGAARSLSAQRDAARLRGTQTQARRDLTASAAGEAPRRRQPPFAPSAAPPWRIPFLALRADARLFHLDSTTLAAHLRLSLPATGPTILPSVSGPEP